ncbi:hypothetical protein R1flu_001452 [Riccia fluitans]|uniref:Uncharacterized protein n=1 Tax=Riccia fluitans TaxID=41844 RepID=A0ABD1Y6A8_9MARC
MIGNPHFAYQVNPNYTYGQMSVPMPSQPLAYGPGPYASQGFHITSSSVHIPSPNFSFAGNPIHIVSALGSTDGENASTVVSNATGRPGPASRPANLGHGTDRPSDERKEADLPATFDQEWIELLDTFMADRPCQNPPFVADSSATDTAIDDFEIRSAQEREHRMTGKRKRVVGENTRFLMSSLNSGLKESMDTLATTMKDCEKMRVESKDK